MPDQLTPSVAARVEGDPKTLPTQAVATVFERDVDLLILEELSSSFPFRAWWLGKVGYKDPEHHKFVRAWHSIPDQAGESDLVFVVEDAREGGYTAGALGVSIFTRPTLSPSCMRRCVMPWQTSFRMSLHT